MCREALVERGGPVGRQGANVWVPRPADQQPPCTQRFNTEERERDGVLGLDATWTIKAQRERQLYHLCASGMYKIYYFITSTSFITKLMLHSIFLTVSGILQDGIRTGACYTITLQGGPGTRAARRAPARLHARHGLHKPPTRVG